MVKLFHRLVNVEERWRECIDYYTLADFVELFCSETLVKIYRIIFFLDDEIYKSDKIYYNSVRKAIENEACNRRFDFFYDIGNPKEQPIMDVKLVVCEESMFHIEIVHFVKPSNVEV